MFNGLGEIAAPNGNLLSCAMQDARSQIHSYLSLDERQREAVREMLQYPIGRIWSFSVHEVVSGDTRRLGIACPQIFEH